MIISHNSIGNTLNFIFFKIMRIAMKCHKFLIYTFVLISALSINNPKSYCLVGLENDNSSSNLPNNGTHIKHESANKTTQKNKKNKNNMLQTGARPSNIPDFPQIDIDEYKMLFDDGFSNIADEMFQTGEEWDIFITQTAGNDINKKYIAGNNDEYTQMDALEAEKKTIADKSQINKENITTHRTRIMAYSTLDQLLFDDIFGALPYGYYITVMNKGG